MEGTLDGIDLEKFVKEVVRLDGGPQTVRGVKKFVDAVVVETVVEPNHDDTFAVKGPLIVKTLNVKRDVIVNNGLVNNVNLKVLDKNRITLTTGIILETVTWKRLKDNGRNLCSH